MAAGACPQSLKCSTQVQLDRFCQARIYDRALLMQTKPVLNQHRIPAGEHTAYHAFVRKLARLCRTYSARVLSRAALDLIDRWEARGLDPEILRVLCRKVFDIEDRTDSIQRHEEDEPPRTPRAPEKATTDKHRCTQIVESPKDKV
jgi:hypothetical protein